MQCSLSEPPDIRPPDDPECIRMRLAACMEGGRSRRDAAVFMERETAAMNQSGYRYWMCGASRLGKRLGADAPAVLLVKGEPDLTVPRVAIVGPRRPDDYGVAMAAEFASVLAARGVIIVSGGAGGVDTVSHTAALEAGGRTICVLGSGFDRPHPPANTALFRRIGATPGCCLISEYPPDMGSHPRFFPERNRIVAGLSDAVIVVQAAFGSGALITARVAIEKGVPLFVVPADIHWTRSAGSNDLLGRGAVAICRPSDLSHVPGLSDVEFPASWKTTVERSAGFGSPWMHKRRQDTRSTVGAEAAGLLERIRAGHARTGAGADPDYLAVDSGTSAARIQALLLELELAGMIRRIPGGAAVPTARARAG